MKCGKIIGVGNTATVYEWEKGKVIKLFYQDYPKTAVEKEFHNAKAISNMNFSKPKVYDIIFYEQRMGIVYDRVEGESLLDWVTTTGDVHGCAVYMAKLHKSIIQYEISNVPNYKEFLKSNILNALTDTSKKQKEALKTLDKMQDGNTLCHGDFHPGNIFISDCHTMVIDFMNICHGNFLYDVARTVFLLEYAPVPLEMKNREIILLFKKALADSYLLEMNVTREMIQDYLSVINAGKASEYPNDAVR
ncbi:MAG: aminoglycoside phosphotransferase family protein [Thermoplasmataceae archaeon]